MGNMISESDGYQLTLSTKLNGNVPMNKVVEIWPIITLMAKFQFLAVNHLSSEEFNDKGGGYTLVALAYKKTTTSNFDARRILVLENISECASWKEIIESHRKGKIGIKAILSKDYDAIIQTHQITDVEDVLGFNVIDAECVLNWKYSNRSCAGASLQLNERLAKQFVALFDALWEVAS